MYLINQANSEIKSINQQTLFQLAEIKRKNKERISETSLKMKQNFHETYNNLLNNFLSSSLLKIKEAILKTKNKLMSDLISTLTDLIKEKIKKNYSGYIDFLLKILENVREIIDRPPEIRITFNSKDYDYFSGNINKIKKIITNNVSLIKSETEFTGGFLCVVATGNISYNYTIENQLKRNITSMEIRFSKIFSDFEADMKNLENKYIRFIQNQKLAIDEYLKDYE
ncbi:MAG: V-type ATP synthase subunit E [Candidatus Hermodarchaeota archaeon]